MSPATTIFLAASVVTATVILLIVGRMANQVRRAVPTERKGSLLALPWILREHGRLFPQSGPMLAFWLSVIFLMVWLACVVFSLGSHF